MPTWHSYTGRPLASEAWLEAHHLAKLPERTAFAKLIAEMAPRRIVDLGCGTGLWLQLLANVVGHKCELIGIDSDNESLQTARTRALDWPRTCEFNTLDFERNASDLPEADVFLAFNVFPYVSNLKGLLSSIKSKLRCGGCLIVRQYDGALLRMGPMSDSDRQLIDLSLMASVVGSGQFKHYDMDRVFQSITESSFVAKEIDFEVFRRIAPYPAEFRSYLSNTIEWTRRYISDEAKDRLDAWCRNTGHGSAIEAPSYFMEVDLVAWLS